MKASRSAVLARVAVACVLAVGAPLAASAMSLSEAIALAQKSNPTLAQSKAQADAAEARLSQANAGRLPTVVLSGQSGWGTTDLSGFFGFGRSDMTPRGASLEFRQPLFAGGAITAAIQRARNGRDAALAQAAGARALLTAQVAQAYVGVLSANRLATMYDAQARQLEEIARQADLKFKAGEVPRTDLDQATARFAGARADRMSRSVERSWPLRGRARRRGPPPVVRWHYFRDFRGAIDEQHDRRAA